MNFQVMVCFYRPACNTSEVMQIIGNVLQLRAHCPTLIHADSSHSHLIVTLTISSKSPNAVALGETPSCTRLTARATPAGYAFLQSHFNMSTFSPQATECQEEHAVLRQKGVVESTLSPCQPCRLPLI